MLQSCDLQAFNLKQLQEVFVLGLLIIPVFSRMMTCVLTVSLWASWKGQVVQKTVAICLISVKTDFPISTVLTA